MPARSADTPNTVREETPSLEDVAMITVIEETELVSTLGSEHVKMQ